ncbi:hypothetical protein ACWF94_12905, partial [Streptomyces sp. NPDC055078]
MIKTLDDALACAEAAVGDPLGLGTTVGPALADYVDRPGGGVVPVHDGASARSVTRLAWLLYELGLYDECRTVVGRLLEWRGHDAPDSGEWTGRLASLAVSLGRPDDARRVLEETRRHRGGDFWSVARTLANLAAVSVAQQDPDAAEDWLAKARKHIGGRKPPAELRELLAGVELSVARRTGSAREIGAAMDELTAASAEVLRAPRTVGSRGFAALARLALAHAETARDEGSAEGLERASGVLETAGQRLSAMLGADHPRSLVLQGQLAAVQVECARAAGSAARLDRSVAVLESVSSRLAGRLGEVHPHTLAACGNLAVARLEYLRTTDDRETVARIAESLAAESRRVTTLLGAGHPVARLVRSVYAACRTLVAGRPEANTAGTVGRANTAGTVVWAGVPGAAALGLAGLRPAARQGGRSVVAAVAVLPDPGLAPAVIAVNDIGNAEAFLVAIDETIKYFNDGDIVDGVIVKVDRDEVLLDI